MQAAWPYIAVQKDTDAPPSRLDRFNARNRPSFAGRPSATGPSETIQLNAIADLKGATRRRAVGGLFELTVSPMHRHEALSGSRLRRGG